MINVFFRQLQKIVQDIKKNDGGFLNKLRRSVSKLSIFYYIFTDGTLRLHYTIMLIYTFGFLVSEKFDFSRVNASVENINSSFTTIGETEGSTH